MGVKETHTEKYLEIANRSVDDLNVPLVPDGDDGYAERFRIAVNLVR